MPIRLLDLRQGVLSRNDALAAELRQRYRAAGVFTLNLVSSPGTGKTALLERTLRTLREMGHPAGALVGDLQTDNDARRLARSGAPVRQILTHGDCHLDARMILAHLEGFDLAPLEFFFIENVGNLVCPSNYDLGEDARVVLLSVTEGEDKPLKYPPMFHSSDIAVITKIDLAEVCDFDRAAVHANIQAVRPGMKILEVSAKTGAGMDAWITHLLSLPPLAGRLRASS